MFYAVVASSPNTIVLNAMRESWQVDSPGFYVHPVRERPATANALYYDRTTKEISYGPAGGGDGGAIPSGGSTGDYLVWNAMSSEWTVGHTRVALGAGSAATGDDAVALGRQGQSVPQFDMCVCV